MSEQRCRGVAAGPRVLARELDPEAAGSIERLVDRWLGEAIGARALLWVSHNLAQAERVTRDYDGRYGHPAWTGDMFVESIYKSLKSAGSKAK